jgi:hypothetical protein
MAQRSNRRSGSLVKNVVFDTAIFMRPGARGTHLGQGLSPETGYVDADQHAILFYPCRRGGPYVFLNVDDRLGASQTLGEAGVGTL